MDTTCALCDRAAVDRHHLTGRTEGRYLDPDLVAGVCHDHHELLGDDMRAEGLERPRGPMGVVRRVAHRLRCVAVFLVRLAGANPDSLWARLGGHLRGWADELDTAVLELAHG